MLILYAGDNTVRALFFSLDLKVYTTTESVMVFVATCIYCRAVTNYDFCIVNHVIFMGLFQKNLNTNL